MKLYRTFVKILTALVILTASNVMAQASSPQGPGDAAQNLPQSYYNSLKNHKIRSGQVVDNSAPTSEPAYTQSAQTVATSVPETGNQAVTTPAPTTTPAVPQVQEVQKPKKVSKALFKKNVSQPPLPSNLNQSYIMTTIGDIKAELAELSAKSKQSDVGKVAGYKGGFFLKSEDNKFRFQTNFRYQMRYAVNFAEDVEDGHTFSMRRLFIMLSGHAYSEKLSYFILTQPLSSPEIIALDVGFDINKHIGVHVVLDSLPKPVESSDSSGKLTFLSRSLVANRFEFYPGFGVIVTGKYKWFSYLAGVYNGLDAGFKNENNELAYGLNLTFDVLNKLSPGMSDQAHSDKPAIQLGLNGNFGHLEDGTQARIIVANSHFRFKYKGFSFTMAGAYRQTDPNQFTRAQTDIGAVVFGSYFIIPKKFEIGARFAMLFDDLTDANVNLNMGAGNITRLGGALGGGDVGGDSDNEWAATVGLNYYIEGYNLKVQGEYSMIVDGIAGPDDLVNHIGMVQFQVGF